MMESYKESARCESQSEEPFTMRTTHNGSRRNHAYGVKSIPQPEVYTDSVPTWLRARSVFPVHRDMA